MALKPWFRLKNRIIHSASYLKFSKLDISNLKIFIQNLIKIWIFLQNFHSIINVINFWSFRIKFSPFRSKIEIKLAPPRQLVATVKSSILLEIVESNRSNDIHWKYHWPYGSLALKAFCHFWLFLTSNPFPKNVLGLHYLATKIQLYIRFHFNIGANGLNRTEIQSFQFLKIEHFADFWTFYPLFKRYMPN